LSNYVYVECKFGGTNNLKSLGYSDDVVKGIMISSLGLNPTSEQAVDVKKAQYNSKRTSCRTVYA
jgi:hypothetical protein